MARSFKRQIIALVLSALIPLAAAAQSANQDFNAAARDRTDIEMLQRTIIAELSGQIPWSDGNQLTSRSTPEERAAAATYLLARAKRLGLTLTTQPYRWRNVNGLVDLLIPPFSGTNLYTIVEATQPNAPFVVVGAHYDSDPGVPGAGDNATGVAVVLTVATQIRQLPVRPVNFLFVLFDQEEDDEVGSRAFAKFLQERAYPIHSVHVTDLAGWDGNGNGVIELQSPGPVLFKLYQTAAERLGLEVRVTTGASSDNKSFLAVGLPTIGVFGDITEHLHQPSDTIETVDFQFLGNIAALMIEVFTNLSAAPLK